MNCRAARETCEVNPPGTATAQSLRSRAANGAGASSRRRRWSATRAPRAERGDERRRSDGFRGPSRREGVPSYDGGRPAAAARRARAPRARDQSESIQARARAPTAGAARTRSAAQRACDYLYYGQPETSRMPRRPHPTIDDDDLTRRRSPRAGRAPGLGGAEARGRVSRSTHDMHDMPVRTKPHCPAWCCRRSAPREAGCRRREENVQTFRTSSPGECVGGQLRGAWSAKRAQLRGAWSAKRARRG